MNKKHIILTAVTLFISIGTYAQVAMGKWRTHFAYNTVNQVEQSENMVFAVSEGKLFSIDKRDDSMQLYSKITGLNGTTVGRIAYDEANKVLLIIYTDGNIDFLTADGIKNLPDFRNKQMNVDKAINDILFHDNKAYLSANFGIMVLNMQKMEIRDTYYIGNNATEVQVLNTTLHQSHFYASSTDAIYKAEANNPQLINYEFWVKLSGLPGTGNIQSIHSFGDWLILLRGDKLYKQDNAQTWTSIEPDLTFNSIQVAENYLIANCSNGTRIYDKNFAVIHVAGVTSILDGKYDKTGSAFWFAANSQGVAKYASDGTANFYKPDGPTVNSPYFLSFSDGRLFMLPGRKWPGHGFLPGVVMIYENDKWKSITSDELATQLPSIRIEDFSSLAVDPDDKTNFFVTGASSGIYAFKNDKLDKLYNYQNSNIEKAFNLTEDQYQWVDNCILDENKNLYFTNDGTGAGVKIMKADGGWAKISHPGVNSKIHLGKILISNQNKNEKWILSQKDKPGFLVYDDNGTLNESNDDKAVFRSIINYPANNEIKSYAPSFYYSIEQEKNGTIWIGTDNGPFKFNPSKEVFSFDYLATRIIIPRNDGTGLGDFLLEGQRVTAIFIDGANRKWFGTEKNGLYLVSEDAIETIHHFTSENSPLISDNILSLTGDPATGEIFIGTDMGLLSYQSDAAEADDVFNDVHIYPNPARQNFTGLITIRGLMEKTTVKITDTAGNLVYQTVSNGSIATWDGKNGFGQKVSTGVYLAICLSPDGQQSSTKKILIIN